MIKHKKGFTIIELIVVIAIIAVLAGIVLVNVQGYMAKAKNAKRNSDIASYVKAFQIYYTDNGKFPFDEPGAELDCCLGSFGGGGCIYGSSTFPECTQTNESIKKYLASLPVTIDLVTGNGSTSNAYYLQQNDGNYEIIWWLAGRDQNCGIANSLAWFDNSGTQCTYRFSL